MSGEAIPIALDPGFGAFKAYRDGKGVALPSAVAVDDGRPIVRVYGVKIGRPPMRISLPEGSFLAGEGAHDWGHPLENMDFRRFVGTIPLRVLFCATMTRMGLGEGEAIRLIVGLPVEVLMGPQGPAAASAAKEAFRGVWTWSADGRERRLEVREVILTTQPVGAFFDYFLDDGGQFQADRYPEFRREIGVINIGMNTVDLLVMQGGVLARRMTGGETLGVRRLLSLLDPRGLYTIAELDARLRRRDLDPAPALPAWEEEVFGFIENQWRGHWRRFARIIAVGGGALLLARALAERFEGKVFLPDDPVMATARGLWKAFLMREA